MQRSNSLIFAALFTSAALVQAQSPLDTIRTPEKAVATVNQSLEGTWLVEVRRAGTPATQAPVLTLQTYQPNGSIIFTATDGTGHGVWLRVGDRKFLHTIFAFNSDLNRVITTISKARINSQLSPDGLSFKGTSEVVILTPDGKVTATSPGGTFTGVRLSAEIPGDFYDFQKLP